MVVNKFDLELLIATNEELETYVSSVLSQVERKFTVRPVGGKRQTPSDPLKVCRLP